MLQYKIKLLFYATKFKKKTVVHGRPAKSRWGTAEARQERDIECVYQGNRTGQQDLALE